MSFEGPNDPRSSEIGNNQIQLTELATNEERIPGFKLFGPTYSQFPFPEIGSSGPPPSTATRSTMHRPLTVPPAGGEPTGGRPHITLSGRARPGPMGGGPATRRSHTSPNPGSGSREWPRLSHAQDGMGD